jgi:hypothetical protein
MLIWGYFKTEPDTGLFLGDRRVIEAHIEPGLDAVSEWIGGEYPGLPPPE